jgi:hypothetical protein
VAKNVPEFGVYDHTTPTKKVVGVFVTFFVRRFILNDQITNNFRFIVNGNLHLPDGTIG